MFYVVRDHKHVRTAKYTHKRHGKNSVFVRFFSDILKRKKKYDKKGSLKLKNNGRKNEASEVIVRMIFIIITDVLLNC